MPRRNLSLEHKVLRRLKALQPRPRSLLLAVSGGVDSMVMAEILWRWRRLLKLDLQVAHVYHGKTARPVQQEFRRRAREMAHQWARQRDLHFVSNPSAPKTELNSEEELRDFRHHWLERWREQFDCDAIAFAHHRDDLLETRVLRLIRGSGRQGLGAMHIYRKRYFRPLLGLSRVEILEYAHACDVEWCEDPTNVNTDALRNWLRQDWLPSLEHRSPGALKALSRSLETMVPKMADFDLGGYVGLRREALSGVSFERKQELLAIYLRSLGVKGYGQTHVQELLKRLDTRRKRISFEMLGLTFKITPDLLWASRV